MSRLADEPASPADDPTGNQMGNGAAPGSEQDGSGQGDISLGRRFLNWQTLGSFVVALVILALLVTRVKIDFGATIRAIAGANPLYFLLALLSYYLVFPIRAVRWRQILRNAGLGEDEVPRLPRLSEIIFLSWFVNCLVPAKLGDVYRAYLLKRWGRVSGSKAGGTILAERLIDLATLLLLAGAVGIISLRGQPPERLQVLVAPLEIVSALVVVAAVGLATVRFWSRWVRGLLPDRARGLYARFEEGAVGAFGTYQVVLPLSVLAWLCEALRLFFVTRSLGVSLASSLPVELAMVTGVALIAALLTALPLTPAGLGFVESGIVGALLLIGVQDEHLAFSVAFLDRTISYASLVVIGLVVYVISQRAWHRR